MIQQLRRIIQFSRELWPYYGAIALLTIVIALINQFEPFLLRDIINKASDTVGASEIAFSGFLLPVIFIFISRVSVTVLNNILGFFGDMMAMKLKRLLSQRYYAHLMVLPQSYFDNEHTGTIIGRLDRSVESITRFFKQSANLFIQTVLTSIISLSIIAYYSWPVAVLLATLIPTYVWFTKLSSVKWRVHQEKILQFNDSANGRFAEVVGQVKVVKAYVQEALELNVYKKAFGNMITATRVQSKQWHAYDIYRGLSQDIILLAIYAFIVWQSWSGAIGVGDLFLLITLSTQMQQPLRFISFIADSLQQMTSGSKDYFAAMDELAETTKRGKKLQFSKGAIGFQGVSFSYDDSTQVLDDVSFSIKPGQKLALVGESGQGKTTITNLLLKLYSPTKGTITIDGQDISSYSQSSVRASMASVFQDPSLFSGTIADNIAYAKPGAPMKEIEAAARKAFAHEFIVKLEDGYQSEIGERGVKLSGGQKQRIAIARAILSDAPMLILDEATSSLDSKAEALVQKALDGLMKGRTTIIIAHRLSTIQHVDVIVTMKNGAVDEIGSPAELAQTNGIYAELLGLQNTVSSNKELLKKYDMISPE